MGALIGGIYATGKLEVYAEWVSALEKIDILRLLDISFSGGGFLRGDKVIRALRGLIGDHQIEDLPIAYTAVAADLKRQREVWLKSGSLFDAIRASIAIPTLFTPVRHDGRLLVDGGLVNPVPIAPTIRDNTDIAIAVDASAANEMRLRHSHRNEPEESSNYRQQIVEFLDNLNLLPKNDSKEEKAMDSMEIMTRSIEVMQSMITRFQLAANSPDVIINIPQNIATFYEFHHAEELINFGYERTRDTFANRQPDHS
jgi:NTE family protein